MYFHAARHDGSPFANHGAMGVPLFFAISGFLITTLLLRERDRNGDISLPAFYARRTLRIFPLYYTVLAVYLVVVATLERNVEDRNEFFTNLPSFLTYTSNWFVPSAGDGRVIFYFAWSLATEEQFYLAWPSLEKWLGRRWLHVPAAVALGLICVHSALCHGSASMERDGFLHVVLCSVGPTICMGVVLAHALFDPRAFKVVSTFVGSRVMSPLLLIGVAAALVLGQGMVAFVLMTLLVGACVIREDHWLAPLLMWPPLVSIGKVSYGIYLLHMLVVNFVERGLDWLEVERGVLVFPLVVVLVWGAAWLSFRYYESYFLRLKARFQR